MRFRAPVLALGLLCACAGPCSVAAEPGSGSIEPCTPEQYILPPGAEATNLEEGLIEDVRLSSLSGEFELALTRLCQAAAANIAQAELMLAGASHAGRLGIHADESIARKWFERAAEHGSSQAMWMLGDYYILGRGGPVRVPAGQQWIRKAAELGSADAQLHLAKDLALGRFGPRDLDEAESWAKKAAHQYPKDAEELIAAIQSLRNQQ